MCGILGGTDPLWAYDDAVGCMSHRGPNAKQVVQLDDLTLGFSRLSIMDLREEANQPMVSNDKQVWITFNGEIYGFQKTRTVLKARGHHFHTSSDTEVVLNAYLEWGDEFLRHIDGMFAIAIYDLRDQRVRIYRDRPGIKPLSYFWDGKEFAFSSELKGINTLCNNYEFQVDNTALYDFLTYLYIPEPKSLYRNVYKLPPAHRLVYDVSNGRVESLDQYWQLPVEIDDKFSKNIDSTCEHLRELVKNSVEDQLIADVPVGMFLSGGIDSSVVVAAAGPRRELNTFSIGWDTEEKNETVYAREISKCFGTNHHQRILPREGLGELSNQLKQWYDEPFGDTSAFPTFVLSKFARESVTVALSGDGGDELFGGYRWYTRYQKLRRYGAGQIGSFSGVVDRFKMRLRAEGFPYRMAQRLSWMTTDFISLYAKLLGDMPFHIKQRAAEQLGIDADYDDYWHFRKFWRKDLPLLTRLQYVDFHTYLPGDILTKVDRVSMANSLEVRVPLLSRELIEFAFSLPVEVRYLHGQLKGLLKQAYTGILPDGILHRDKQGFSIPRSYKRHMNGSIPTTQFYILEELFGLSMESASQAMHLARL